MSVFRIGGWDLGVRCSAMELHVAVRRMLATYLQPRLEGAPGNYSLRLATASAPGEPRKLHELFEGDVILWRSRTVTELLQAFLRRLEVEVLVERDDLLALSSALLV